MRNWLAALLLIFVLPELGQAQTYRWVDEAGAVHYAQGIDNIPERYRSQARPAAVEPPPSPRPPIEKRRRPPSSPPPAHRVTWKPSEPLAETTRVPLPHGAKILVTAKINGQGPVTLLLDTAARGTVVSAQALQRLGISAARDVCHSCELEGFGWRAKVDEVQLLSLQVGDAKLTGPAFIKDLDVIASIADGILGRDFLDNFTVTIDPKQRLLTLAPTTLPGSGEGEPNTPSAHRTRISFPSYQDILVTATINGQGPVTLLLDTGASRTWVSAQALRRLGIPVTYGGYGTFEGLGEVGKAQVASVEVGEVKVGSLSVYAFDERPGKATDGLLGLDFLSHFTVTIDPSGGVATLTAAPAPGEQGVTPIPGPDQDAVRGRAGIDPRERPIAAQRPPSRQATGATRGARDQDGSPGQRVTGATPTQQRQWLWAAASALLVVAFWTLQVIRRRRENRASDRTLAQHPGTPGAPARRRHLNCPRCSRRLDKLDTDEGIVVYWCGACRGTWHDEGLLDEFSRLSGVPELLERKPLHSQFPSDLRCPRCDVPMEEIGLGEVKFLVHRCRSCRGLWLDPEEVPKGGAAEETKPDEIAGQWRPAADRGRGMTDGLVVYLSRTKRISLVVGALVVFVLVGSAALLDADEWWEVAWGVLFMPLAACGLLYVLYRLCRRRPALIVNREGIVDLTAPLSEGMMITWEGIDKLLVHDSRAPSPPTPFDRFDPGPDSPRPAELILCVVPKGSTPWVRLRGIHIPLTALRMSPETFVQGIRRYCPGTVQVHWEPWPDSSLSGGRSGRRQ